MSSSVPPDSSSLNLDEAAFASAAAGNNNTKTSSKKKKKESSSATSTSDPPSSTATTKRRIVTVAYDYYIFTEELIGEGSYGKVYPATCKFDEERVVPGQEKYVAKFCAAEDKDMFKNEGDHIVAVHRKWNTPYVINLVARYFITKQTPSGVERKGVMIFERCFGPSLHRLLVRDGPLPIHLLQRFLAQMIEALVCLHGVHHKKADGSYEYYGSSITHRDIKPDNFLLTSNDLEKADICLIDFGLSIRGISREPSGTPMFSPPEMINGSAHETPADIFSLGVTILFMIFGAFEHPQYGTLMKIPRPPLAAGTITPKFVTDNIDSSSPYHGLVPLIQSCVAADPSKRPRAEDLRKLPWIRAAGVKRAKETANLRRVSTAALAMSKKTTPTPTPTQNSTSSGNDADQQKKRSGLDDDEENPSPLERNTSSLSTVALSRKLTDPKEEKQKNLKEKEQQQETTKQDPAEAQNATSNPNEIKEVQNNEEEVSLSSSQSSFAVKNDAMHQLDNFTDRVQALLTIANSLYLPSRRASVCAKVARLLVEEISRKTKGMLPSSSSTALGDGNSSITNNSFTNTSFLSEKFQQPPSSSFARGGADHPRSKNNDSNNNTDREGEGQDFQASLLGLRQQLTPLLEQLQWVKSQLASMRNVVSQEDPLPDCDVAIADGVKNLASAALRAMLVNQTECSFGDCAIMIRFCRIVLKKDLAHYSELNYLRRELDDFAIKNF